MRGIRAVLAVAMLTMLAACSTSPSVIPAQWRSVAYKGVVIDVPPGWTVEREAPCPSRERIFDLGVGTAIADCAATAPRNLAIVRDWGQQQFGSPSLWTVVAINGQQALIAKSTNRRERLAAFPALGVQVSIVSDEPGIPERVVNSVQQTPVH